MQLQSEAKEFSHTVTLGSRLEVAQVDENLYVFERTTALDAKGKKLAKSHGLSVSGPQRGFVDEENMNKLVKNQAFKTLNLSIWTPEQFEKARLEGFSEAAERGFGLNGSLLAKLSERDDLTADNVVHEKWDSHMVFDRHGNVLPVAVHFDYIESGIDESHFDLEALADALLQLPDVRVLPRDGGRPVKTKDGYARDTSTAKSPKEAIFPIPGYNASEGRTRSIQFVWLPSQEDYAKVWEWAQKHDKQFPSTCMRAGFWALDIHGLSRFRLTPPEE
jgi:hypothetical protein